MFDITELTYANLILILHFIPILFFRMEENIITLSNATNALVKFHHARKVLLNLVRTVYFKMVDISVHCIPVNADSTEHIFSYTIRIDLAFTFFLNPCLNYRRQRRDN
jgi:hypothetical protein